MPSVFQFVKDLGLTGKTLDIGSMNLNGCVRELFTDYTGLDMRSGPNVDIVANSHEIPFPNKHFVNVLNLETMEHDNKFWETAREMYRVCAPGGHVVITVPGVGFPKHEHPSDYWRFLPEGIMSLMEYVGFTCIIWRQNETSVFYHGRRV